MFRGDRGMVRDFRVLGGALGCFKVQSFRVLGLEWFYGFGASGGLGVLVVSGFAVDGTPV